MSAADSTPGGPSAPGRAAPDDPQALLDEISRTRAELGDTVEALAARVDVKARAQQRAAEVSAQARGKLQELAGLASGVTGQSGQAGQAALSSGTTVLGSGQPAAAQLTGRVAQAGTAAWNLLPVPVRRGAQRAACTAGQYRVPAAVAAGAGAVLVAGWLVLRRRHR